MTSGGRVAFLGSPDFAVAALRALVEHGTNVVGVVTQPDRPAGRGKKMRPPAVKVHAQSVGLPIWQPTKIRGGRLRRWFEELNVDLAVVAAFGRILTRPMLEAPRLGCVNVHASLLPRWRGASPIHRAIVAGDRQSGVCLMQMDTGLDTGPVLARATAPISDNDTAATLHDKLAALGADLLTRHIDELLGARMTAHPQPTQGVTYAPLLTKDEGFVDWNAPAQTVHNQVRGMSPWPGAWTLGPHGARWKIHAEGAKPALLNGQPGELLEVGDVDVVIGCGNGSIRLSQVQRPGKRRGPAAAVIRGARLPIGARFGGDG